MENKKLTPQEFVDYLKGFIEIAGARVFTAEEISKMKELLDSVSTRQIHYNPVLTQLAFSPTVPTLPHINVTTPGAPDWHLPTNICYNYNEN